MRGYSQGLAIMSCMLANSGTLCRLNVHYLQAIEGSCHYHAIQRWWLTELPAGQAGRHAVPSHCKCMLIDANGRQAQQLYYMQCCTGHVYQL